MLGQSSGVSHSRRSDETVLPTYFLETSITRLITPATEAISATPASAAGKDTSQRPVNNSPTNLIASSSVSMSSRLPTTISLTSSLSSSVGSSASFSHQNGSANNRKESLDFRHRESLQRILASSRSARSAGLGVQKRYRRPHIYQHEVCHSNT